MEHQLYRAHRTLGYDAGRTQNADGKELVILHTSPHPGPREFSVTFGHMLIPAGTEDVQRQIMFELQEVLERATFLGLDADAIRAAFEGALTTVLSSTPT